MTLTVSLATEHDAQKIGELHMRAFADNGMLHAQFHLPIRHLLEQSVSQKAADEIKNPHGLVLVARDPDLNNELVSYAEWALPTTTSDNEPPWKFPQGTRFDILETWTEKVESAKAKTLGDKPCYRESPA